MQEMVADGEESSPAVLFWSAPGEGDIIPAMNPQRAVSEDVGCGEMLDADTSAALIRWLETASVLDGVGVDVWQRWVDGGCQSHLQVEGRRITPAMLGRWGRGVGNPQ